MKAEGGHPNFHTKEPDQSCIPAENLTRWLTAPSNTTNVKCSAQLQGHSSDQSSSIHPSWSSSLVCFTDDERNNAKRGRIGALGWRSDETGASLKETEIDSSHQGGGTTSEKFSEAAGNQGCAQEREEWKEPLSSRSG